MGSNDVDLMEKFIKMPMDLLKKEWNIITDSVEEENRWSESDFVKVIEWIKKAVQEGTHCKNYLRPEGCMRCIGVVSKNGICDQCGSQESDRTQLERRVAV